MNSLSNSWHLNRVVDEETGCFSIRCDSMSDVQHSTEFEFSTPSDVLKWFLIPVRSEGQSGNYRRFYLVWLWQSSPNWGRIKLNRSPMRNKRTINVHAKCGRNKTKSSSGLSARISQRSRYKSPALVQWPSPDFFVTGPFCLLLFFFFFFFFWFLFLPQFYWLHRQFKWNQQWIMDEFWWQKHGRVVWKEGQKKNKKQMHRFKWQIDRWNEPGRKFHWKIAGVWVTEKSPERLLIITRMNRSMAQILFDFLFRLIAVNGEFWLAAKFRPASSNQCHLIAFIASFLFRDGSLG